MMHMAMKAIGPTGAPEQQASFSAGAARKPHQEWFYQVSVRRSL
jgi:hypothetical protein